MGREHAPEDKVISLPRVGGVKSGARPLVWIGLFVTLLAAIPLALAEIQWKLLGATLLSLGLPLYLWAGWRCRRPAKSVFVDRARGLVRVEPEGVEHPFDQLGELSQRHYQSLVTVYAACRPKLPLFERTGVSTKKSFADDWIVDLRAAMSEFDPAGWRWDEVHVEAALSAYKLTDRNRLLWRAAHVAGEERVLREQTLLLAAGEIARRNATDVLAGVGFGLARSASENGWANSAMILLTGAALLTVLAPVFTSTFISIAMLPAVGLSVVWVAQLWRVRGRVSVGKALTAACALTLCAKPFLRPVLPPARYAEQGPYAVDSEVHLFFYGAAAAVVVLWYLIASEVATAKKP